ncbi:hypothetical protein ACFE04_006845 [Oxalis oulophora]
MDNARKVFDSMLEKDLIAWNALISGHSLDEEDIEAVRLLPSIHKFGVGFNQTTLSTALKSIAKLQAIDSSSSMHMEKADMFKKRRENLKIARQLKCIKEG